MTQKERQKKNSRGEQDELFSSFLLVPSMLEDSIKPTREGNYPIKTT